MHRLQEIVRLRRLGRGSRSIARELKISPNTERRYRTIFAEAGLLEGDPDTSRRPRSVSTTRRRN